MEAPRAGEDRLASTHSLWSKQTLRCGHRRAPRRALRGETMQTAEPEALNPHEKLLIDQAIAEQAGRPGELLGILESVQSANAHKYLPIESLRYIAEKTGVPPARVYSAATFYALFNLDLQGDNVVCVCRGTACHTRGSRDLLEKVCLDLGMSERDLDDQNEADKLSLTTPDRRFTIRTVACFGQCALAPVVEVNHHILSRVNERTLQRELKALIKGGK
jgi:NADH-quinone oxidoreductase subunit E